MKVLESLIGMIQKFPYDDPTYAKLHEDLDRIRGRFKQVCPWCFFWWACLPQKSRGPWGLTLLMVSGCVCKAFCVSTAESRGEVLGLLEGVDIDKQSCSYREVGSSL